MKKELLRQNLRAYFLDCEAIHYNYNVSRIHVSFISHFTYFILLFYSVLDIT